MENYFTSQRDHIFKNVEVLIYVFDVESRDVERDMHYYQSCLEAIMANSREAKIFCLVHKMDLVQEHQRDKVRRSNRQFLPRHTLPPHLIILLIQMYEERVGELKTRSEPLKIKTFRTSIWDETLYAVSHHDEQSTLCKAKTNTKRYSYVLHRRGQPLYML
jgi:Ras-related GTP-binding protein A/B